MEKTGKGAPLPDAAEFSKRLETTLGLRGECEEQSRRLRADVTAALEEIAASLDGPLALGAELPMPVSDSEEDEREPECDEYSEYLCVTGFRYNEDEGTAEALDLGWEDPENDDEGSDPMEGYAFNIGRFVNRDLCELYAAVKAALGAP